MRVYGRGKDGEDLASPDAARAVAMLRRSFTLRPKLGFILGSGFQSAVECLRVRHEIAYSDIPGFGQPQVAGHAGKLLIGRFEQTPQTPVVVLSGRTHYYEGYSMAVVTFGVRVLAQLGVQDLVLTNAAGGINRRFRPGDFMVLKDHINLMGVNPLRSSGSAYGTHFIDLSCAYDPWLSERLRLAAHDVGLRLWRGVYLAVSGPSYETPAEIRAFRRLGADAVGMSTVPEVLVARACGMKVAALSCITNLAAGIGRVPLSHAEVLATAERVRLQAAHLLRQFCRRYEAESPARPRA